MRKMLCHALATLMFSISLTQGAAAAALVPDQASPPVWAADAFDGLPIADIGVLDASAMEATDGKLLPMLPAIAAITAIDLALATFFWGVYVPHYAPKVPICTRCDRVPLQRH